MDKKIKYIIIGCCVILSFWLLSISFQGDEKESLLDFSCDELAHKSISTDGKDGRFVTDFMSIGGWVKSDFLYEAGIEKGCFQLNSGLDKFDYKQYSANFWGGMK